MCNCVKCLRNDLVSFYPSAIEINYLILSYLKMFTLSIGLQMIQTSMEFLHLCQFTHFFNEVVLKGLPLVSKDFLKPPIMHQKFLP